MRKIVQPKMAIIRCVRSFAKRKEIKLKKVISNCNEFKVWSDNIPDEVISLRKAKNGINDILEYIAILDVSYGSNRNIESGLGGYTVLFYGNEKCIKKEYQDLLDKYNLEEKEYEYEDKYEYPNCTCVVTVRVYLCSADYAIVIVMIKNEEKKNEKYS